MSSALAVDHEAGPPIPTRFGQAPRKRSQSPLPPEWSNPTRPLRDAANRLRELFGAEH